MTKFLDNQRQGIILLIIAALIWAPLPNILPWNTIAALALIGLGLYNLFT
jgi:hypothetical protein